MLDLIIIVTDLIKFNLIRNTRNWEQAQYVLLMMMLSHIFYESMSQFGANWILHLDGFNVLFSEIIWSNKFQCWLLIKKIHFKKARKMRCHYFYLSHSMTLDISVALSFLFAIFVTWSIFDGYVQLYFSYIQLNWKRDTEKNV